jgi:hypothetical protein
VKGNVVPLKIYERRDKGHLPKLLLVFCLERSHSVKNLAGTITATLGLVTIITDTYVMALCTISSDHNEAPTLVEPNASDLPPRLMISFFARFGRGETGRASGP